MTMISSLSDGVNTRHADTWRVAWRTTHPRGALRHYENVMLIRYMFYSFRLFSDKYHEISDYLF